MLRSPAHFRPACDTLRVWRQSFFPNGVLLCIIYSIGHSKDKRHLGHCTSKSHACTAVCLPPPFPAFGPRACPPPRRFLHFAPIIASSLTTLLPAPAVPGCRRLADELHSRADRTERQPASRDVQSLGLLVDRAPLHHVSPKRNKKQNQISVLLARQRLTANRQPRLNLLNESPTTGLPPSQCVSVSSYWRPPRPPPPR